MSWKMMLGLIQKHALVALMSSGVFMCLVPGQVLSMDSLSSLKQEKTLRGTEIRDFRRFKSRGDIVNLPTELKERMAELYLRPHTYPPQMAFSEADDASQLFQYYLLDTTSFQPSVFTSRIPGLNDQAIQTGANAANNNLPTIGAVRVCWNQKKGCRLILTTQGPS